MGTPYAAFSAILVRIVTVCCVSNPMKRRVFPVTAFAAPRPGGTSVTMLAV
jgi:hypothetical protein